jgi:hypothetical protein
MYSLSLFHTKQLETMEKEIKKVWEELISLYDIADQLEDNGQDAEEVRIKLNNITDFFVKNFEKDLHK